MTDTSFDFAPERHEPALRAILSAVAEAPEALDPGDLQRLLRRYPKDGRGFFSKSELVRGYRHLRDRSFVELHDLDEGELLERLRMKPVRTRSGVAPVTVLTKPFPCPGRCIFCPSDVRMPKSYLSDEPGAQRAAEHQFDPYRQTFSRLLSYHHTGHRVDKVELIILGGTWSFYPEPYQIWFILRCFEAMNDFASGRRRLGRLRPTIDFRELDTVVDGARIDRRYNQVVRDFTDRERGVAPGLEAAGWSRLEDAQRRNETASVRCVGLVVETRPDRIDADEVRRIRRLGATKVQIGYQSLDDEVLRLNRRGHDVDATRRAMRLLRAAGFKIHAHWMPNLYGSTPSSDLAGFERMFSDPDFCPDELKIYPCSLIESAELMAYHRDGRWRPYDHDELLSLLTACMLRVPRWCRVTRVIRDIPGTDIVTGNKITNFRQVVEDELRRRGERSVDIRAREVRGRIVEPGELSFATHAYPVSGGEERFLECTIPGDRLVGFLRLQLPGSAKDGERSCMTELEGAALLREVHVYGALVGLGARDGGKAQHLGVGRRLISMASDQASRAGFESLAVISSVGTREYYRALGFEDGALYQHLRLATDHGCREVAS